MRKEVLAAGLGWIIAGIVSISVWYVLNNARICNCPNIPEGSTAAIQCCAPKNGDLYTGAITLAVGIFILLLGNSISAEVEKRLKRVKASKA